jgi:hypothetical protein
MRGGDDKDVELARAIICAGAAADRVNYLAVSDVIGVRDVLA